MEPRNNARFHAFCQYSQTNWDKLLSFYRLYLILFILYF